MPEQERIAVEQTDIEKCKEVFEYEMTEVLLKLQGEFSAISGKDTKINLDAVETERLRVETKPIAQVKVDCEAVYLPHAEVRVPDVHNTTAIQIKEITVPQVPDGSISALTAPEPEIEPAAVCNHTMVHPLNMESVQKLTVPNIQKFIFRVSAPAQPKIEKLPIYAAEDVHIRVPTVPARINLGRKSE